MEIIINDLNDLPDAARKLLPTLRDRGVVALYGGMGAGKTTLVAALLREMGSTDDVSSPTFALVNDYLVPASAPVFVSGVADGALPEGFAAEDSTRTYSLGRETEKVRQTRRDHENRHVYHFDFYRIDDIREAFDLGYEEYFYSGDLCLIEWPEKIEELLPPDTLRLRIDTLSDGSRKISSDR